jgi:hypothetical protein
VLFWRGQGIVTFIILMAAVALVYFVQGPLSTRNVYLSCGIILAAGALNWFVGRAAYSELGDQPFWKRHSLFWIPMEWWTLAFAAYAILGFAFWNSLRH